MVPISIILNEIHGFFALIYFGSVMVFGIAVVPRIGKLSEGTVGEMARIFFPPILSFVEATGMVTVVFGAGEFLHYLLGYYRLGGMKEVYGIIFGTTWGLSILVGGILGLIGFFIGFFIAHYLERIFKLFRSLDPSTEVEIEMIQKRLNFLSIIGAVLLCITVILMILAVSVLPLPLT
ncbi:hypothetical protein [Acidianus sp. RZ1]|uniref:hypothetical protein n=1 Tax=Acidianus sp. RZ1 TaxID=1540082 RepID=UPI001492C0EE|nr:hypothetical protein [Acidianus sp. RZ1]NON62969.1 hypothetical protein [Acidianus sp. RZ1]